MIDRAQPELAALAAHEDRRRLRAHRVSDRRGARKLVWVSGMQLVLNVRHPDDLFTAVALHDHPAALVGIGFAGMRMNGREAGLIERECHRASPLPLASRACTRRV